LYWAEGCVDELREGGWYAGFEASMAILWAVVVRGSVAWTTEAAVGCVAVAVAVVCRRDVGSDGPH
jgi:hypothetical protein